MFTVFSALDERARPKGSRDPLGAEATWSFMGRKIVGNLTTVTSSLDNFIVAILCCEFANTGHTSIVQARYLRFEQLAAYLRLLANGSTENLLGVSRARANLERTHIQLGNSSDAQLLADQASYGLWGLYSTALEGAGLIRGHDRRPTVAGQELLSNIITQLGTANWGKLTAMAERSQLERSSISAFAPVFNAMLRNPALRRLAVEALLARQKDCALQSELYDLAQRYLEKNKAVDIPAFCEFALEAGNAKQDMRLTLTRIRELDPVLQRAELVMNWLQGKADTPLEVLSEALTPFLAGVLPDASWTEVAGLPHSAFLNTFHKACVQCAPNAAIQAVLDQNRNVMAQRGGAAWLDVDSSRLVVRVRNDRGVNLDRLAGDSGSFRHTYFIGSFLSIANQGRI